MLKVKSIRHFGQSFCETYLVSNGNEGYLIDPGSIIFKDGVIPNLESNLKLKGVILTHCHIDHMLYARNVADHYNVPIIAHKDDKVLALGFPIQVQLYFQGNKPENIINKPLHIDQYVKDGDVLKLGDEEIHVIHTPGHSPGSIMLYMPQIKSLISGDNIFLGEYGITVGRTDFPLSNHKQFIKSIEEKILTLPDDTIVYPGHDSASSTIDFPLYRWSEYWKQSRNNY